ncbi:MAG: Antitoxin of toxin-antitoxin stability system [Moraxellaceae bacterium]|jgi:prevent-host-death family protein|nr:Antitoxin of toxin-antitoxin stability system [Moraxellaceae bacterium]
MSTAATVNIHHAKTHLSQLLEQVRQGQEVIIAKAGHPIARLAPLQPEAGRIAPPGSLAGRGYAISDDFDAPVDQLFDALGAPAP